MRCFAVALLSLVCCSISAETLPVRGYASPECGPAASVRDVTIALSANMTVRIESGEAAPLLAAGKQIGLFVSGKGTYEYRSPDAAEAPILKYEAKKASDLKVTEAEGARVLKGTFERMAIRGNSIPLPDLPAGGAGSLTEKWGNHREVWSRRTYQTASHILALDQLDALDRPLAFVEFSGGSGDILYTLDPVETRSESVVSFFKVRAIRPLMNHLWPAIISEQPLGRNRRDFPEPRYLLTALDYTLVGDAEENATLSVTETIVPRGSAQRAFRFDLHSSVFDANEGAREYQLRSVKDASGTDVPFDHSDGSVLVVLPRKMPADVPFQLKFEIAGRFLYHPNGDSYWQLGTEPWFPQPDLNGQYYTIHSVVKTQKPFVPFAPGETVRRVEEANFNVVENRIDKPVQFAVVLAGKYSYEEKTYEDGLTVRVASYAGKNGLAMKQLNNLAWKMIKFYEPWLGPFPFKEFNVIEIAQLGWGQAPPATMFITREAFNPIQAEDTQFFSRGVNHRFAHEIAHQYWGHVVKMSSGEEQWITEAFAEYSSALVIRQLKGKNGYDTLLASWRANAADSSNISPIPFANRIVVPSEPFWSPHRANLIYDKGAFLLGVIHKQMGDSKFLTFMRNLQALHQWRFLSTVEVAQLLQKINGGKDYMPFFEQYYWGTAMPKP